MWIKILGLAFMIIVVNEVIKFVLRKYKRQK